MIYRIIALIIMAIFYLFYIGKLVSQNKKSIKTNQAGTGDKPHKVIITERIMSCATILTIIVEVVSICMANVTLAPSVRAIGIALGIMGVLSFALATISMQDSWRVGIPEEKTVLVTNGIYKWSRNPAFVGFDLLYLSICLLYFNIPLLMVSLWAAIMLHLQILQEETHMENMFGEEYVQYKKKTMRYFGKKVVCLKMKATCRWK